MLLQFHSSRAAKSTHHRPCLRCGSLHHLKIVSGSSSMAQPTTTMLLIERWAAVHATTAILMTAAAAITPGENRERAAGKAPDVIMHANMP